MLRQGSSTGPAERKASSANGVAGPEPAAPGSNLFRVVLRSFEEIWGSVESLVEIKTDRIRISMRRSIVGAALGACVAVCTALWLVATGLGAALGFVGVPIVPHAFRWIVRTATRVPQLTAQMPGGASGFVLNALRGFRALR